jgi:hypothetical protein
MFIENWSQGVIYVEWVDRLRVRHPGECASHRGHKFVVCRQGLEVVVTDDFADDVDGHLGGLRSSQHEYLVIRTIESKL